MSIVKCVICFLLILIDYRSTIVCSDLKPETIIKEIETIFVILDETQNGFKSLAENFTKSGHESLHHCSSTQLIDKFIESITPDDYEEGQKMNIYGQIKSVGELNDRIERLNNLSSNISKTFEPILTRLQMRISENLLFIDLPQECLNSLARIGVAIRNSETWAMNFMDTFPSPNGKAIPLGDYDSCLMIESPQTKEDVPVIKGQYCSLGSPKILPTNKEYMKNELDQSVIVRVNDLSTQFMDKNNISMTSPNSRMKGFKMTKELIYDIIKLNDLGDQFIKPPMAICIPTTCSPKHIEYAINKVLYPITRMPVVINPDCDYVDKPIKLNKYQITSISIFSVLTILVLISTLFDFWENHLKNKNTLNKSTLLTKIGLSFSGISNFKHIFWSERTNKRFRMLDGIRTILAFSNLLLHEHQTSTLVFLHAKDNAFGYRLISSKKYIHVTNFNLVEVFFFLAGMMTCYVMLSKLSKSKGRFNYFQYVLFRYLRLIPVTMGSILLIFILPLLGNGPIWNLMTSLLYIPCYNNWLPALLMTSNFDITIPDKYVCNLGNWSTSADFQVHLLAPIIFLVLYYWPKSGVIWNIIIIGVGAFICVAPRLIWDIPFFLEFPEFDSIFTFPNLVITYYLRFESHIVSYAFGMLCGYLIRQKPNLYFGGLIGELLLWITSWTLTFYSMNWLHNLFDPYYPLGRIEILLYLTFSKLMFLSGWFWLFYACATERAGFINKFFSWKGFKATGNLGYEISVLHVMVIVYRIGVSRSPVIFSAYYVWTNACFDYLLSFIISIIFYVIVSAPFTNLVNIFVK